MELTEIEQIILNNTDKDYTYIARFSRYGDLVLISHQPEEYNGGWVQLGKNLDFSCYNHLFRNLNYGEWFKFR